MKKNKIKLKPDKITLTPFGKLHLKASLTLRPILNDSWNAVLDTLLQNPDFISLKAVIGKSNYDKVVKLIEAKRHDYVSHDVMWETPMTKKYMCPHCALQSNSEITMKKHLTERHPGKIGFYLVGPPFPSN